MRTASLLHSVYFLVSNPVLLFSAAEDDEPVASTAFASQLELLDDDLRLYLESCPFGTAERCLITARLFGDESELMFWTVALHYIRAARCGTSTTSMGTLLPRSASSAVPGDAGLFLPIVATPVREAFDLLVFENEDGSEVSVGHRPAC